ncbi:MAG: class II fructose-bisphosphatase, partial [Hyphomonadaceae bacterium]|nr:class II fructose-bisphosphatase [Hyphomonadaceae bacterium]
MSVMSDELAFALARAPIAAAIAAAKLIGRGDEEAADQAAVNAMRAGLNALAIKGRVVIGEGERDEAPMLYIGEEVGAGKGPALDIALDPLEGTTLTAKAMPNALAVIAFAPRDGLLHAPDTYMDKLAIGPGYDQDVVDLDASADLNVRALAKAKGVRPEEIGVCVLDRPRHAATIEALRSVGCRVYLIPDGDIAGVINCTKPETGIDMYLGQGGAPEGVLAAAALKCVGGQFQARLVFRNDEERA